MSFAIYKIDFTLDINYATRTGGYLYVVSINLILFI